jgi:hypothetical protein
VGTIVPAREAQTALAAAQELHALGLNVFPQPLGQKGGYPWKPMQYTRLLAEDLPAVFAQRCNVAVMVGRTSGNLFVLDCESERVFSRLCDAVRARGIPLWAAQTARGGHIYMRSGAGVVKSIAPGRIPEIEVRGQGGYVLAPPSVHPDGPIYTWLACEGAAPPVVQPGAIDFLTDASGQPVRLEVTRAGGGAPRLNRATRDYLANGHALPEGERHKRFFTACCNYRDCGLTRADVERELVPIARASGLPEASDPHALERVMTWAEENVTPKTRALARAALPNPDALAWEGRSARTDYAVFAALVLRARLGSNQAGVFRASWRELMNSAGVASMATLRKALARLQERQLVERWRGEDEHSGAALWCFGNAAKCAQSVALGITPREESSATLYAHFSPAEQRILAAVSTAAAPLRTRQDVARAADLSRGAVQNALRAEGPLRMAGYVTKAAGAWRMGKPDMLAVQERHDKAEAKRRRVKQRTERERARWAARRILRARLRSD